MNELKSYFDALDEDGSKEIGASELEDPLIALGLADSREQVEEIIKLVDTGGSGEITFNEFLSIIKGSVGHNETISAERMVAIY